MTRSVIHIGANKAASTTLQRALFSKHTGLHYVGEDAEGYPGYAELVNSMVSDDDLHFRAEECSRLFKEHLAAEPEKTFLYSNEDVMTSRIPTVCARRLHEYIPNAEILLIVRNQYTAVPSFYANHGAFLKPAPPSYFRRHVSFNDWIAYQLMFIGYGALASFKYNTLLSVYEELFGRDHVHVLMFEEFLRDKGTFVERLSTILRIDPGEAYRALEYSHERKRYTNRMLAYNKFRTSFLWGVDLTKYLPFGGVLSKWFEMFLEGGRAAQVVMSNEIKEKLHALYGTENALLAAKYNLPLGQYGYPLGRADRVGYVKEKS